LVGLRRQSRRRSAAPIRSRTCIDRSQAYTHEYRIRRRDGSVRWVENHGLAYFEGAGPERHVAGFVGTLADITERKDREEREHLLMREG
jgi:PAS domain S-box-containing protein